MPNNFSHIGLIHLILPNARIIDARRHPLACCFSGYKQLFARGQTYTYDLTDIGRYYRDYVELMDHWDRVLPGRVHRVQYEEMVADTEGQVRRLLDYCGLPFEEQCLRFYETERAIRTASSEQVRQPGLYRRGRALAPFPAASGAADCRAGPSDGSLPHLTGAPTGTRTHANGGGCRSHPSPFSLRPRGQSPDLIVPPVSSFMKR